MLSRHAFEGGVDVMLIWTIVAVTSVALLGGVLLASKRRTRRRNRTSEVWSETDVDYKARNDLIPKLEETLRGYAFRPRGALQSVTRARAGTLSTRATGGTNVEQS
jgi:hypothetical protein